MHAGDEVRAGRARRSRACRRRMPASRAGSAGRSGSPAAASAGSAPGRAGRAARRAHVPRPRAARPAARACRDGVGVRKTARTGPVSTTLPAYITATWLQICATTPRLCVISSTRQPVLPHQAVEQAQDLRLDGDVERGGRLVRDRAGPAGRSAPWRSARAGACRRRTGADSRRPARRVRDADACPASRSPGARGTAWPARRAHAEQSGSGAPACSATSTICVADAEGRIQVRRRVLEDHADAPPAQRAHLASSGSASRSCPSKMDLARGGSAPAAARRGARRTGRSATCRSPSRRPCPRSRRASTAR